jgi:pimeloyl-ACP methyl ester carboxylesterase
MQESRVFGYSSQGLRLNVCEWGARDAPPLVLLHGVRDHARSWDGIAASFADRYRVLAPDLRGHGDSEHARGGFYPTEGYVFDLAELVEQERLAPFIFIGHSLGGNIGLRYAGLYPDRVNRIVAIEGLAHSPTLVAKERARPIEQRLRDWIERQRDIASKPPRRYASLEEATAKVAAQHPRFEPGFAAHLTRHGVRAHADGTVSFKFDPALRAFPPVELAPEDGWRLWSMIECPTLLVYGAQSWASNPVVDGRAVHFRSAQVETLEGAGHWAHHDQREGFLAAVERFLGDGSSRLSLLESTP